MMMIEEGEEGEAGEEGEEGEDVLPEEPERKAEHPPRRRTLEPPSGHVSPTGRVKPSFSARFWSRECRRHDHPGDTQETVLV